MHSNLRLEVPESVLSDGIFKDNKPLSAISLKTLLFLMYYFDGNCEDKVTVPLSDLCFMFGHDSNALCSNNRAHHARRIISHLERITDQPLSFGGYYDMVCIDSVDSDIRKNLCTVHFSHKFIHYWNDCLEQKFYFVNIGNLFHLHTLPSVLLYLFCLQYKTTVIVSVSRLAMLLTGNPDYPYKLLKKDKLRPAIAAISSNTSLQIQFGEISFNRGVQKISFTFTHKSIAQDDNVPDNENEEQEKLLNSPNGGLHFLSDEELRDWEKIQEDCARKHYWNRYWDY